MLVLMTHDANPSDVEAVKDKVGVLGSFRHEIQGAQHTAAAVTGIEGRLSVDMFQCLSRVADILTVAKPTELVRLETFRILMERIRELGESVGRTSPEEVSGEV